MRVIVTCDGIFRPLVDYFSEHQSRSLAWQSLVAQGVGMLIDYMQVKAEHYRTPERHGLVLADFAQALRMGTLPDAADGGLRWPGMSGDRTNRLVARVCDFSDWLVSDRGTAPLAGTREASPGERIALMRQANRRSATGLLRHLRPQEGWVHSRPNVRRLTPFSTVPDHTGEETAKFPHGRIMELLLEGFRRPGARLGDPIHQTHNLRDMLITILMHGGGIRVSEAFHIYAGDVAEDPSRPGHALVRVYHPELGLAKWRNPLTGQVVRMTRSQYLKKIYNLKPRNLVVGKQRAGWKNPALTEQHNEKYMQVFWFPQAWGQLFWSLYGHYLRSCYPKRRLDHPYLFVSLHHDKDHGKPYTLPMFHKNHARAIGRIGMEAAKGAGTTPHGHRHALGSRMDQAGVPGIIQTRILHHANPMSRLRYNQRSTGEIRETLSRLEVAGDGNAVTGDSEGQIVDEINAYLTSIDPVHALSPLGRGTVR